MARPTRLVARRPHFAPPQLSRPFRYGAAVGFVAAACLLQRAFLPPPSVSEFLFFYLAVSLTAWVGGSGPGLVASALSAVAANVFFMAPLYRFSWWGQAGRATLAYLLVSAMVAVLGGALRNAVTEEREALGAQRRTSEALAASEARLRMAQQSSGLGIYDHDLRTGAIDWDDRLREMWGLGESEPLSWDWILSAVHPDDRAAFLSALRRADAGKGDYSFEHRVLNARDGRERWLRATGHTLFEDGVPVRHVGTVEDITDRKHAAEALHRANRKLAEADQRKNDFLGVLSHELRNPLAPIRNSLYILTRASPGSEQGRRALEVIDRQIGQLCTLVDDLLDVTRIARGKIRLQRSRMDLVELVRRTAEDHRAALEADHAFALRLPEAAVWLEGDPTRIGQVVGNLLANAAKFTPAGGAVSLSLARAGERALLEVADTGVGIDPETLERLFQPFAQADRSLDRSRGGLGLGLALVKGIVELHGGEVSAHSDGPGKGSRFTVSLPVEQPAWTAEALAGRDSPNPS